MIERGLYRDDVQGIAGALASLEAGKCPSCDGSLTRAHAEGPLAGDYGICIANGVGYQCVRSAEGHAFLVVVSADGLQVEPKP